MNLIFNGSFQFNMAYSTFSVGITKYFGCWFQTVSKYCVSRFLSEPVYLLYISFKIIGIKYLFSMLIISNCTIEAVSVWRNCNFSEC